MSAVTIYAEGGGNSAATKVRNGMNRFLGRLNAARARPWRWNLVFCGDRNNAYNKFNTARKNNDPGILVLLVDSEGPVDASPRDHLAMEDRWNLRGVENDRIHLMVEVMETWIVADPEALAAYYGRQFRANVLPTRQNLEEICKAQIINALERATERTRKGRYDKVSHAGLLARIDQKKLGSAAGIAHACSTLSEQPSRRDEAAFSRNFAPTVG